MNSKDSVELILAIVAVIVGGMGLMTASVSLALIVGLKNSTHQVVWKPLEEQKLEDEDPFIYSPVEDPIAENPNKKIKTPKEDEEFADISDPLVTSNDW